MTAVGGSIVEVSLSGRPFAVPADNEAQLMIGGFNNEVQMNGNKSGRLIKTVVANGVDGLLIEIDHSKGDLEFVQSLADLKDFFVMTAELSNGSVYQGKAQITGDVQGSTQSATAAVTLRGPLSLTTQ